jgi:hypothetical protein
MVSCAQRKDGLVSSLSAGGHIYWQEDRWKILVKNRKKLMERSKCDMF